MPLKFYKLFIFYSSLLLSVILFFGHQTNLSAKLSLIVLTLVIFIKPAVKLFPNLIFFKTLLAIRRQLGQASAFFALAHASIQVRGYVFTFNITDFRFWGLLAIIFMIPLLITSNDFSTRLLKRNWFLLQKLIHPLYIFALIHYGLQKGPPVLALCLVVLVVLYLSRFLANHAV